MKFRARLLALPLSNFNLDITHKCKLNYYVIKNIILQIHPNDIYLKRKSIKKNVFLLVLKSDLGFNTFIVPLSCPKAANLRSSLKLQQEMGDS